LRYTIKDKKLAKLYETGKGPSDYPPEVVAAFQRRLATISAVASEQDLYALAALHYEKLKGKRLGQRSIRLHDRWRLIVAIEEDAQGQSMVILEISNHYDQ
jgi:toxin HigB-1